MKAWLERFGAVVHENYFSHLLIAIVLINFISIVQWRDRQRVKFS